jgi:hypothetical protein
MKCVETDCIGEVAENEERCPVCGADNGPLNLRFCYDPREKDALSKRYEDAWARARGGAYDSVLQRFEEVLRHSVAVVNEKLEVLELLVTADRELYTNYNLQVGAQQRRPAAPDDDRRRRGVEAILFGRYGDHIRYAALSLDGRGVQSYGPFAIQLRQIAVRKRASVLEENCYQFVEIHGLKPGDPIPPGYRAAWAERHILAVAKLSHFLTPQTQDAEFAGLLLRSTQKRADDEFMEVHLYGGFNSQAVEAVTAEPSATRGVQRARLKVVRALVEKSGAKWVDA